MDLIDDYRLTNFLNGFITFYPIKYNLGYGIHKFVVHICLESLYDAQILHVTPFPSTAGI